MRYLRLAGSGSALALPALGAFAATLVACGGGYGSSSGGSGITTCDSGCATTCPSPTVSVAAPAAGGHREWHGHADGGRELASIYGPTNTSLENLVDTASGTATTSPYTVSWYGTTVSNGMHSLTAKVPDSMGDTDPP